MPECFDVQTHSTQLDLLKDLTVPSCRFGTGSDLLHLALGHLWPSLRCQKQLGRAEGGQAKTLSLREDERNKKLLGTRHLTTSNKKLLVAPDITI